MNITLDKIGCNDSALKNIHKKLNTSLNYTEWVHFVTTQKFSYVVKIDGKVQGAMFITPIDSPNTVVASCYVSSDDYNKDIIPLLIGSTKAIEYGSINKIYLESNNLNFLKQVSDQYKTNTRNNYLEVNI
jgi:hypothetical protein